MEERSMTSIEFYEQLFKDIDELLQIAIQSNDQSAIHKYNYTMDSIQDRIIALKEKE